MPAAQRHFASRNHLPPEILAEIAEHLVSEDILDTSDRYKNFGSSCLVSRSFRQAFRPKQFRRISIHDPLPADAPRYKPSMQAFASLLAHDSTISTYVRRLRLTMDFTLIPTSPKGEYAPSAEALAYGPAALSSLSHVEELTWDTSFPGTEVPFQAIVEPMKQAILHILRLPTLKKLECHNIDGISIEDIPRHITSLALRDAALSRGSTPEKERSASPGSTGSRSSSRSSSSSERHASVITQIRDLSLSNIDSYWARQLVDAMEYHPTAFGAVGHLTTTNVEIGVVRRVLLCAGESLRKLRMSFVPLSEYDLDRYFGYLDLSTNAGLESLTLSFGCWLSPATLDRHLCSLSKTLRSLAHSNLASLRIEVQTQHREGVIPLLAPSSWACINSVFEDPSDLDDEDQHRDHKFPRLCSVTLHVSNFEYPMLGGMRKSFAGVDRAVAEARHGLLPALSESLGARFELETNFADPFMW